MTGRVIEPGYVEKLLRHAIGGAIEDKPGKPPLDKRDVYVRLARVDRVYPYKQEALITPFKYFGEPNFRGWYAKIAFPFFDDHTLIAYIPRKKGDGYDSNGYYIIPDDTIYALTVAVEGMADEKGRYIIGFVKREDHELTASQTLYEGVILEFGDSKIELRDDKIIMSKGENGIILSSDGVEIQGKLKINGEDYPSDYIVIEGSTEPMER